MMTRRVLLTAAICLASFLCLEPANAPAQTQQGERGYTDVPQMPRGIEGERIQMLFDAVNDGDMDLVRQLYEDALSQDVKSQISENDFVGFFERFAKQAGGIEFHSVREYDPPRPDQTVVIFRDSNFGAWKAFSLFYAQGDKPNGLLQGISINQARTPSDVESPGPLTEAEAVDEVRAFVERLCGRDLFSGTLLVARGDTVLLEDYCGEASKRFHAPVYIDTKFNLGSMNKMFTSTAIMQLVEKGIVSLDDPLSKYLDETWLPREITDKIKVRHLLSHTSGLGSYFNETFEAGSRLRWRELDDYKELVHGDTLAFEPGTNWQYSNTGMLLLGVVIEKATGVNYFDYIRENIYAPAGMENTDCYDMDCPVENLAIGYWPSTECASGWKNNLYEHVIRGGPAGGGFSTVRDLYKFARALQTGRLVSPESLEMMWTEQFDANRPYGYGFGFSLRPGPHGLIVGHGGGFTGINANLDIFLDQGYIVAVMSNYDEGATPVQMKVAELLGRVE